jgi:hypothetical protein
MAVITVRPTKFDVTVANAIAAQTGPRTEASAEALTWGRTNTSFVRSQRIGGCLRARRVRKRGPQATTFFSRRSSQARCLICSRAFSTRSGPIDGRCADIGAASLSPATGSTHFLRGTPSTSVLLASAASILPAKRIAQSDEFNAAIGIKIDQVSIRRT